jgi:hypothetical protein
MLWQEAHISSALVRSTTVPVVFVRQKWPRNTLRWFTSVCSDSIIELFRVPLSPCEAYAFLNKENRAKPRIGCVCSNRHGGRLRQ